MNLETCQVCRRKFHITKKSGVIVQHGIKRKFISGSSIRLEGAICPGSNKPSGEQIQEGEPKKNRRSYPLNLGIQRLHRSKDPQIKSCVKVNMNRTPEEWDALRKEAERKGGFLT